MAVLVTCKLKMIGSKVKVLSFGQHFLHYKSMGKFFIAQGRVTLKWTVWSGNSSKFYDCLHLHASLMTIQWKMKSLSSGQQFPHYKSMGAIGCHGNSNFDPIYPKALCYVSFPHPVMLHTKFDQDWPTGLRDIQIWKCGWRLQQLDGRRTSGELNICQMKSKGLSSNHYDHLNTPW